MTLEDHAGDVVRKSRLMFEITPETAASAGGISVAELTAFEQSGKAPASLDYEGLARRLDVSAAKLRKLVEGWAPAPVDLSGWPEFRMLTSFGDDMSVNCYLVWDEVTREAALFDTGFDAAPIFKVIESEGLQLMHVFITHTHGDHVAALEPIRERYPKVRLHTGAKSAPPQHRNRPNDFVHLGSLRITNRETPGHAEDGATYILGTSADGVPPLAIVGDAMFAGSIGGAPGKGKLAKDKIRENIFSLPPSTLICPGHGPMTTVGEQKAANPFFA